jgi:hypothetical protein
MLVLLQRIVQQLIRMSRIKGVDRLQATFIQLKHSNKVNEKGHLGQSRRRAPYPHSCLQFAPALHLHGSLLDSLV